MCVREIYPFQSATNSTPSQHLRTADAQKAHCASAIAAAAMLEPLSFKLQELDSLNQDNLVDELASIWKACSKASSYMHEGHRLSNLSWRLWSKSFTFEPPSDPEDAWEDSSEEDDSDSERSPARLMSTQVISSSRSSSAPDRPTFLRSQASLQRMQKSRTGSFNAHSKISPAKVVSLFSSIKTRSIKMPQNSPSRRSLAIAMLQRYRGHHQRQR